MSLLLIHLQGRKKLYDRELSRGPSVIHPVNDVLNEPMAVAQLSYVRPSPKRFASHTTSCLLELFLDDQSNVRFGCPLVCASAVRFAIDEGRGTRLTKDCGGAMVSAEAIDNSKKPLQKILMEYIIVPLMTKDVCWHGSFKYLRLRCGEAVRGEGSPANSHMMLVETSDPVD